MTTTDDQTGLNGKVRHLHPLTPEELLHEQGPEGDQDGDDTTTSDRDVQTTEEVHIGRILARAKRSEAAPTIAPWERDYSDRPTVLPPYLRTRTDFRMMFRHWIGQVRYWTGIGLFRLYPKLVLYSPRGVWRAMIAWSYWQWYLESRQARLDALAAGNINEWRALEGLRVRAVARRGLITLLVLAGLFFVTLIGNGLLWWFGGPYLVLSVAALAGASAPIPLGLIGRPMDKPLATLPHRPQGPFVLRPELIQKAFVAAKLASEKHPVVPIDEPHRDGPGWRARVKVPEGISATKAVEKREELASGFDVLADQLFLKTQRGQASGSQRVVEIWIADVVPATIPAGVTPLLQVKRLDFWQPFPIGVDERGNKVLLTLLWLSVIIAGLPRMGKTFVARMFCLAAALDPYVQIRIFDFRPSADWKPLRLVAHEMHSGVTRDPDTGLNPVQRLDEVCDELLAEIERRGHVLRSLPYGICPEGKITPEISRSPNLHMPLMLTVVDEFHVPIQDDVRGESIGTKLADIVKRGPAVGAITVTCTQKPGGLKGEAGRLYAQIRDSSAARFILRCPNKQVSNLATGNPDLDASALPPAAKGAILVNGAEAEIEITDGLVRTFLADSTHADEICRRGRKVREEAGTLSGMALGITPEQEQTEARSIVADLLTVMVGAEQMHSDKLAFRLAQEWPTAYPGWDQGTTGVRSITLALKPWNVVPGDTWDAEPLIPGTSPNKTGVKRDDLLRALAGAAAVKESYEAAAIDLRDAGKRTTTPQVDADDDTEDVTDGLDPELVAEAAELVVRFGYASPAMLQRKLRLNQATATSVIDALQAAGVVDAEGPGSSRRVLIQQSDLAGTLLMIRGDA